MTRNKTRRKTGRIEYKDGSRGLAARIIYDAVKDMRDTRVQSKEELRQGRKMAHRGYAIDRLHATVWLGSKDARMWFDHVNMDQRTALQIAGWVQRNVESWRLGSTHLGPVVTSDVVASKPPENPHESSTVTGVTGVVGRKTRA